MKKFLSVILLTAILSCGSALAVPIPLRGVVEGFYGTPWTFEDRADIIDFCRQNNLSQCVTAKSLSA